MPRFPPTARGYDVSEVVSAFQKAVRRSDTHAALYWAYELDKSNFGAWAWKRMKVMCSEDIGPAAPGLAADLRALYDNWMDARKNARGGDTSEGVLYFTHAVIALATAPKNRVVDWAIWHHDNDHVERMEIPDEALDKHTLRGKRKQRGNEHFMESASMLRDFDGSLEELEAEYRQRAHREHVEADPTLPDNPWAPRVEPAQSQLLPKTHHVDG